MSLSYLNDHIKEITELGCTVIPEQISSEQLGLLNKAADRAISAVDNAIASGIKPRHTQMNPYVRAARCFYCWDKSCRNLLAHDTVNVLGNKILKNARLWDMSVLEARPMPEDAELGPFQWHRDFPVSIDDNGQSYLWVFICLTDTTSENGATWVIPRSHRDETINQPQQGSVKELAVPSGIQLTAKAGDIVVINPVALHSVGENRTLDVRRLLLIGLCSSDRLPLLNHWAIAGNDIQNEASDRLRQLLSIDNSFLEDDWDVLPENWHTKSLGKRIKRFVKKVIRRLKITFLKN
jgi:ectoine hydroxylase-related dioxygenase (phytanoyl-CoA dioxygenase family)